MKNIILLFIATLFALTVQAQPGTLLSAKKIGDDNNFQFFDTMTGVGNFGISVCNIGDLNGDGITDIAVGARRSGPTTGLVYILFMDSTGGMKSYSLITKNEGGLNTTSPNAFTEFGQSIANLGDLDGDGVVDIAVGNKGSGYGGEVYILYLNKDGNVKNHSRIASNVGGFSHTLATNQHFSRSISNIGDVDGDGVVDIAVGNDLDGDGGINKGSVYILFLNSNGTVKKFQKISQLTGGFSGTLGPDSRFGISVCLYKKQRIIVGARSDSSVNGYRGAIWLLDIDSNGMVQTQKKINDASPGFNDTLSFIAGFSSSIASIGDLDGDSVTEIAVGADSYDDISFSTGAVFIMSLDENDNIKFLRRYSNSVGDLPFTFNQSSRFGRSVSSIGDFNKDKKLDIVVGSSGENGNKGRLNLLFLDGIEHNLSVSNLFANSRSISVYPNPTDSKIKLAINGSTLQQASVQITDISGKSCLSIQNFNLENEIDVSLLKAGVYFVRLQTSDGIFQSKLIIHQ